MLIVIAIWAALAIFTALFLRGAAIASGSASGGRAELDVEIEPHGEIPARAISKAGLVHNTASGQRAIAPTAR
jgi:hypothetical protein